MRKGQNLQICEKRRSHIFDIWTEGVNFTLFSLKERDTLHTVKIGTKFESTRVYQSKGHHQRRGGTVSLNLLLCLEFCYTSQLAIQLADCHLRSRGQSVERNPLQLFGGLHPDAPQSKPNPNSCGHPMPAVHSRPEAAAQPVDAEVLLFEPNVAADADDEVTRLEDEYEEEEEKDEVCDLPAYVQNEALRLGLMKAKELSTLKSYERAGTRFLTWLVANSRQPGIAEILKVVDGEWTIKFDVLALKLESVENPYCRYTLAFQMQMHTKGKSGLGHIKTLRSWMADRFYDNKIEVSKIACATLKRWAQSRRREDMQAKIRAVRPIRYSNARDALPFNGYQQIAKLMAQEPDPFLFVLLSWQWNMIARCCNVVGLQFSQLMWKDDHLTTKHPKSKKDQTGKRAFRFAIMANRYNFTLCPVTALAIYLSCTTFEEGNNMVFPAGEKGAGPRYSSALRTFLKRPDIKAKIEKYCHLLLGTHSCRKGATNHGASGALVAGLLMSVLLRGQWDIGATLSRYFKEHQAADCCIARVLAGLDIYDPSFAALPPHFVGEISDALKEAIRAQFSTCPLLDNPGQFEVLEMCYASLLHHHDDICATLPSHHPLLQTPLFKMAGSMRAKLRGKLGPELGACGREQSRAGEMRATGIPPHTVTMKQLDKIERRLDAIERGQKELAEKVDSLCEKVDRVRTHGIVTVGAEALKEIVVAAIAEQLPLRSGASSSSSSGAGGSGDGDEKDDAGGGEEDGEGADLAQVDVIPTRKRKP